MDTEKSQEIAGKGPTGSCIETIDPWSDRIPLLVPLRGRTWMVWSGYEVTIPYRLQDDLGIYPTSPIWIFHGFTTDLSSSPRILWPWIPPFGPYTGAAILHDFMYNQQYAMGRKKVDEVFYHHMVESGTRRSLALVKYRAVRVGGWKAWNRHSRSQS